MVIAREFALLVAKKQCGRTNGNSENYRSSASMMQVIIHILKEKTNDGVKDCHMFVNKKQIL